MIKVAYNESKKPNGRKSSPNSSSYCGLVNELREPFESSEIPCPDFRLCCIMNSHSGGLHQMPYSVSKKASKRSCLGVKLAGLGSLPNVSNTAAWVGSKSS